MWKKKPSKAVRSRWVLGVTLLISGLVYGGPPQPRHRSIPGTRKGAVETRWLGPYVLATEGVVGPESFTTVRWFKPDDGTLIREVSGKGVTPQPGFVSKSKDGVTIIHGVNEDWVLTLPKKEGPPGYITATRDSHTFVHQFHPREGQIAVDVYTAGKLIRTVGPFRQYLGRSIRLRPNGNLAFLTWKDATGQSAQVVVVGRDGKITFRADCGHPVDDPEVTPQGDGVLLARNDGGNTFEFYTTQGKVSAFEVGPNPFFVEWLPGTIKAVFWTSVGHTKSYRLVDVEAGKTIWEIPDPAKGHTIRPLDWIAVERECMLLGGLEFLRIGENNGPVRSLYALDPKSGEVLSRWRPWPSSPHFSLDGGAFVKLRGKLFLVAADEFAELSVEEILLKKNGWR